MTSTTTSLIPTQSSSVKTERPSRLLGEMYKTYNEEAKVSVPLSQRAFKEELKNYFHDYTERFSMEDGTRVRSYYSGFRTEKFEEQTIIEVSRSQQLG